MKHPYVKTRLQYRILPLLFTLAGMLLGLMLHCFFPAAVTPVWFMLHGGILGWLLSHIFIKPQRCCSVPQPE